MDDDFEALEEMADALQSYGLDVHTATDEETALEQALKYSPEFVMMDYLLRGSTGLNAVGEIHKHLPDTKIIMISGFEDLFSVVTSMNSVNDGVIAVLRKPLSMDSIARFISNQLEQKNKELRAAK